MSELTELKGESFLVQDGYGYKDVDTYIKLPDGSEWLFRTYLDRETNEIIKADPRYATSPDDSFDDAENEPPVEVLAAYETAMPEIMKLIETGSLQQAVLASVDGLTATGAAPILSQTICFQAGDKSIVLDEKGLHYCGKLVGDADIAGAFKDYLHSSGVLSVGSAERLLCIIPQLIQLCLEQGHAIRHLDEDSQYCELWSNDGGYVPDWRFSTARSLVIANRPELWPLEDRLPVEMWYIHAQGEDGEDLDLMVRAASKDRAVELWKQYYSWYAESYPAIDWIGKVPAGFGEGAINWGDIIGEEEENG
jgi:hypothetical protein